ncbi:hypothetical protein GQX74_015699 [Glossina fuscipes]|nr:hypothetical protein GQX74_015699 [Glossina fuscipes]
MSTMYAITFYNTETMSYQDANVSPTRTPTHTLSQRYQTRTRILPVYIIRNYPLLHYTTPYLPLSPPTSTDVPRLTAYSIPKSFFIASLSAFMLLCMFYIRKSALECVFIFIISMLAMITQQSFINTCIYDLYWYDLFNIACAVPQPKIFYPFFVLIFYVLSVIPMMLAKRLSPGSETNPKTQFALFLTSGMVLSSFALPIVLAQLWKSNKKMT